MSRLRLLFAFALCACGDEAKAPVPIGFTGKCELSVPHASTASLRTADETKAHVVIRVVKDMLVGVHVEVPDNRHAGIEELPDHPLVVGDAAPNVLVDRGGDIDVPMQLRARDTQGEPWDSVVRVRFRDEKAEVVAGLMVLSGPCVVAKE